MAVDFDLGFDTETNYRDYMSDSWNAYTESLGMELDRLDDEREEFERLFEHLLLLGVVDTYDEHDLSLEDVRRMFAYIEMDYHGAGARDL